MFEDHCHGLDVDIVDERIEAEDTDTTTRTNFDYQVASEASRKCQLQEQLKDNQHQLEILEEDTPLNQLHDPESNIAQNVQQMRHNVVEMVCSCTQQ